MAEELERIYIIPLRKNGYNQSKAAPTAIKRVKNFLTRHMKVDIENIWIDDSLNAHVHARHYILHAHTRPSRLPRSHPQHGHRLRRRTTSPRPRHPVSGTPGPLNAITDVAGVEVGYTTLIQGEGKLEVGKGPVRTGVTAVLPRGRRDLGGVFGAYAVGNGNGEMTGTIWIEESGIVGTPVLITNTHSVAVVRDAVIAWMLQNGGTEQLWGLPVVAETWDGYLNDLNGFHVRREHVFAALDGAHGGAIAEGNVGGGTGMHTFEFKGGTGTSSRRVRVHGVADYTVGVLVQSNFGRPSSSPRPCSSSSAT